MIFHRPTGSGILTSSSSFPSTRSSHDAILPSESSASGLAGLKVLEMYSLSLRFCCRHKHKDTVGTSGHFWTHQSWALWYQRKIQRCFMFRCSKGIVFSYREREYLHSQLHNWMISTEMCLLHLTPPLWTREVQETALNQRHQRPGSSCCWGFNCLAQGQNGRFFHLVSLRIQTFGLLDQPLSFGLLALNR